MMKAEQMGVCGGGELGQRNQVDHLAKAVHNNQYDSEALRQTQTCMTKGGENKEAGGVLQGPGGES